MAFHVTIAPEALQYLGTRERLTANDQARIVAGVEEELGRLADQFHNQNPHPYLPDRYWYGHLLVTEAHEIRAFRFACDASGHVFGVTEVLYAEEWPDDGE